LWILLATVLIWCIRYLFVAESWLWFLYSCFVVLCHQDCRFICCDLQSFSLLLCRSQHIRQRC